MKLTFEAPSIDLVVETPEGSVTITTTYHLKEDGRVTSDDHITLTLRDCDFNVVTE